VLNLLAFSPSQSPGPKWTGQEVNLVVAEATEVLRGRKLVAFELAVGTTATGRKIKEFDVRRQRVLRGAGEDLVTTRWFQRKISCLTSQVKKRSAITLSKRCAIRMMLSEGNWPGGDLFGACAFP